MKSTRQSSMSRFIYSQCCNITQKVHSICYSTKRIDVVQSQRYSYSTSAILLMPMKTIEICSLPGPDFVDSDGKLIDRAKITEIFFESNHRVFGGDAILAIEKEGIHKNNVKRELSYVLSPVSGHIERYHVNVKDYIRVGDPIYDIDTMDDYETPQATIALPSAPKAAKRKIVYLPLQKETLRYYRLIQNEVDSLHDEIRKLKLRRKGSSDSTATPNLVNTTAPPALTSEMTKLIHRKLEIYERVLNLKLDAYQNTTKTLTSPDTKEYEMLQYERINDFDPLEVALTYRSMGLLYMRLQKMDDAYESMKEAVMFRRKKNRHGGFKHFDLLQDVLVLLGTINHRKGELEGARRCLYEAFRAQTRYLGHTYDPIIANTVHLLGEVYYALGKFEEALQSYGTARRVFCDIGTSLPKDRLPGSLPQIPSADFGPAKTIDELKVRYKIETAKVLHNMSIVQERLGKRSLALDCAVQELRLRKSVLPANDISIATCHYMIGDLLVADGGQQKKDPPLQHFESALSIYDSNYGSHHETVAMTYVSIGALHLMHKKHDEAFENYKKGIEIMEVAVGKISPDVASVYLYAGQALFEKGEGSYEDALKHFFHAYDILKDLTISTTKVDSDQVTDDPDEKGKNIQFILTSTIQSIGNSYVEQGNVERAIAFYHEAVELLISKIGRKRHADVAHIYFVLAQTLAGKKDFAGAWNYFTKARGIFSFIYGDHHPETAACYYNIGLVLREDQNRIAEALEALQKARDRWLKEYGSDHTNVVEVENRISETENMTLQCYSEY